MVRYQNTLQTTKGYFKTGTTCRVVVDALNVSDAIVPLVQTRSSPKIAWNIDNYYQTSIHWYKHFFCSSTTALKNDRDNDNALNLQNYTKILFEIAISIHDASSLNILDNFVPMYSEYQAIP